MYKDHMPTDFTASCNCRTNVRLILRAMLSLCSFYNFVAQNGAKLQ